MTLVPEDRFAGAALVAWWQQFRAETFASFDVTDGEIEAVLADGGAAGSHWYGQVTPTVIDRTGNLTFVEVIGDFDVCMEAQAFDGTLSTPPTADGTAKIVALMAHDPTRPVGHRNFVHIGMGRAPNRDAGAGVVIEHKTHVESVSTWNTIVHPSPSDCRCWLRIARVGSRFFMYYGTDGVTWTLAATFDRPDLPQLLEVGFTLYAESDVADLAGRIFSFGNTPDGDTHVSNSTSIEVALLEWFTQAEAFPDPPDELWLALSTTTIGETWDATEPVAMAYERIPITFGAVTQSGGRSVCSSDADIAFPQATGNWGNIVDAAVVDTESGAPTYYRRASNWSARNIQTGGLLELPAGSVVLRQG